MDLLSCYSTGFFYKRIVTEVGYPQYLIVSVVNAVSNQVNATTTVRTLNVLDGVVLTEAIRYAISQTRNYLGLHVSYMIFDIEDNQIPFHEYYHIPFLSVATSRQISSYLYLRKQTMTNPAPFVSALPFSARDEDFSIDNTNRRINFAAVPPSRYETAALIDILSNLSWKFVTLIVAEDEIGQKKIQEFTNLAFEQGICVGRIVRISNTANSYDISKAVNTLKQEKNETVVVSLVDSSQIRGILQSNIEGIQFIMGTSIRASRNEINFSKNTAKGLLILQHDDTRDEGFNKYFMGLQLASNAYSWFSEFWSEIFQCTIPPSLRSIYATYKSYSRTCTGYEKLNEDLIDLRYALVKPVLNSVRTMLCALKKSILKRTCNTFSPLLPMFATECGTNIMRNSSKYFGKYDCNMNGTGSFNNDGYINRKYAILNFNGIDYNEVGSWHYDEKRRTGTLNLSKNSITWNWGSHKATSCYYKCRKGEIEDRGPDGKICCFKCKKCSVVDEIVQNNTCTKCKKFEVPSSTRKSCFPLPRIFITSRSASVLALELAALIGILLSICIIGIFVKYRHSLVVKSTGRHLSITMILSVTISQCASIIFFLQPTLIRCGIQKILLGQCLGSFYIPMLLKTVRIYRIFEASKNFIRNPMLVSTKSQLILCCLGILANLFLGILLAVSKPTTVKEEAIESYTKVAVFCNHNPVDAITSLVPCLVLLSACTYFGYKTRHFPSNFNESFRISITMYISCFLWGVYIPLLYVFQNNKQIPFMTNFITAGLMITLAFVNLIGIFGTTFVKAIKNNHIEPEKRGTSTFAAMLYTNTSAASKKYRDIGLDPIEF